VFADWLNLSLQRQAADLTRYLASAANGAASLDRSALARFGPASAEEEEMDLFIHDICSILATPPLQNAGDANASEAQAEPALQQS
jgi:hypothetical protein